MAVKVNKVFVGAVIGGVVALAGVLAFVAVYSQRRTPAQHYAAAGEALARAEAAQQQGNRAEAQKAISSAVISAGKAVNRERMNVEYLRRWEQALERYAPERDYQVQFIEQYVFGVLKGLAEALPGDLEAQRKFIWTRMRPMMWAGTSTAEWTSMAQAVSDAMGRLTGEGKGEEARKLVRYRGIARAFIAINAATQRPQDVEAARRDLRDALEVDPGDALAAAMLMQLDHNVAMRERARGTDPQEETIREIVRFGEDWVARHGPDPAVVRMITMIEMSEEAVARGGVAVAVAQLQAAHQPRARRMLDCLKAWDPARTDVQMAWDMIIRSMATGVPGGLEDAELILARLAEAQPLNPLVPLYRAQLIQTTRLEEALERFEQVAGLPNPPLSFEGMQMPLVKLEAARSQVFLAVALFERERNAGRPEQAQAWMKRAKEYRDRFAALAVDDANALRLIDGVLALSENRLVEGRKLLTEYNARLQRPDRRASLWLAQAHVRSGAAGLAEQELRRLVDSQQGDWQVFDMLGELLLQRNDAQGALAMTETALTLNPGEPRLLERRRIILDAMAGTRAESPLIRDLATIQERLNQRPPDLEGALALTRQAAERARDATSRFAIANYLLQLGAREEARRLVETGLAEAPGDPRLTQLKRALDLPVTPEGFRQLVESGAGTPEQKALSKFVIGRQYGWADFMTEGLEELRRANPNHTLVLSQDFDDAIAAERWDKAAELVRRAAEHNADTVDGLLFRTQLALARRQLDEAHSGVLQILSKNPFEPAFWRLRAEIHAQRNEPREAVDAMRKALEIRPEDPVSHEMLLDMRLRFQQPMEALEVAREGRRYASGSPSFIEKWLRLEYQYGDQNLAIETRRAIFAQRPEWRDNGVQLLAMLLRSRQIEGAEQVLAELSKQPPGAEALDLLPARVSIAQIRGDEAGARAMVEAAFAAQPAERRTWAFFTDLAISLQMVGQTPSAILVAEAGRPHQSRAMEVDRLLGDLYSAAGDPSRAAQAYQRALEAGGEDPDGRLFLALASARLMSGNSAQTESMLASAAMGGWSEEAQLRARLLQVEALALQQKFDQARRILDELVERWPRAAMAWFKRGQLDMYDVSKAARVKADLARAVELEPGFLLARRQLALMRMRDGDSEGAVATMRAGVDLDPGNVEARLMLVELLRGLRRETEALAAVEQAMQTSRDPRWPRMAAEMYTAQGDLRRARDNWEKVWELSRSPMAALQFVDVLLSMQPPEVVKAATVLADPTLQTEERVQLLMARARVARLDRRDRDFRRDLDNAFQLAWTIPDTGLALQAVGIFFAELPKVIPNPAERLRYLREAQATASSSGPVRVFFGRELLAGPVTAEEGRLVVRELLASGDGAVRSAAARVLGEWHYARREFAEAVEHWKIGLAVTPDDPQLLNNIGYVTSKHLGRHEEALPLVERAAQLASGNASILDSLGLVYMKLGRHADAERVLTSALEVASTAVERVPALIHLALLHLEMNRPERVEGLLKEAEALMARDTRLAETYADELRLARARAQSPN
jgi:tetratricopeptide (TPR) repeat protein